MEEGRSYTIHKSKKSQIDRDLTARESLRVTLAQTDYRLEPVGKIDGVTYVNDSRACDLLSTRDSFKCILKPIVWLAAEPPHERDYALIENYVKYKVKAVIVSGGKAEDMKRKLEHLVENFSSGLNLREAVRLAHTISDAGDAVVYSPGCTPHDDYRNFVDRGDQFALYVEELKRK